MNSSRNKINQRRRSGTRQRNNPQGLLEVNVRSKLAIRQRNRTVLVWFCKIMLACAVISGGIYGGRKAVDRMFLKNPEYNLAAVEITDDGSALSREVILSAAKLEVGQNIFSVSLSKAREAIVALPQTITIE